MSYRVLLEQIVEERNNSWVAWQKAYDNQEWDKADKAMGQLEGYSKSINIIINDPKCKFAPKVHGSGLISVVRVQFLCA